MSDDPNLKEEQAAQKWGPDLTRALAMLQNHFPDISSWDLSGVVGDGVTRVNYVALLMSGSARRSWAVTSFIDPVWALCLAMENAAADGFWHEVPPPPPPPPAPEAPESAA